MSNWHFIHRVYEVPRPETALIVGLHSDIST